MDDKELAYQAIYQNLISIFESMEMKNILIDPVNNLTSPGEFPAIALQRGTDSIDESRRSNRSGLGYPAPRIFEFIVDYSEEKNRLIGGEAVGIVEKLNQIRRVILQSGSYYDKETYGGRVTVREKGISGPGPSPLLGHTTTRLVFVMTYMDQGPF